MSPRRRLCRYPNGRRRGPHSVQQAQSCRAEHLSVNAAPGPEAMSRTAQRRQARLGGRGAEYPWRAAKPPTNAATTDGRRRPRPVTGRGLRGSGRSGSALLEGRGRRNGGQAVGLVVDRDGDLAEPGLVLVEVVGAEEQVEPGVEGRSDIGLGATPVAPVGGGELTRGDR